MRRECELCGKECNMWHAQYGKRGLCAKCNETHTYLPDGSLVMWEQYAEYHKKQKQQRTKATF